MGTLPGPRVLIKTHIWNGNGTRVRERAGPPTQDQALPAAGELSVAAQGSVAPVLGLSKCRLGARAWAAGRGGMEAQRLHLPV